MVKTDLRAPWYIYRRKLNALFESDPDISVSGLEDGSDYRADYVIFVTATSPEKRVALDRYIKHRVEFGNVSVAIVVNGPDGNTIDLDAFQTIFDGNTLVHDIATRADVTGTMEIGFVRFNTDLIQFEGDNICDYNGNITMLPQDVAADVFEPRGFGINFCTVDVRENSK